MIRTESACRFSPSQARLTATLLAALLMLAALGFAASARAAAPVAAVPAGFVGVDGDGPLFLTGDHLNFDHQASTMTSAGVESIRVAFNWAAEQPYQNFSEVPLGQANQYTNVGGVPTDFGYTDALVGTAARHGISVFPTILYAPPWDATPNPNGVDTPTDPGPFAAYAAALVGRYGPRGSFWRANPGIPKLPIRMWQIWNEPNIAYYWPQPFGSSYVSLLRAAHAAIKQADPGAKVVLGALTNRAWVSLGQLNGIKNLFDVAAVNGFTKTPADVILYLRLMRRAMNHLGYRQKGLLATELSWPSAVGKGTTQRFDFDVTERGQARNIATLLPLLGQVRVQFGLTGIYYYTWVGDESPGHHELAFDYAGLEGYSRGRTFAKPALAAFKRGALALEGCARKGARATVCAKRAS